MIWQVYCPGLFNPDETLNDNASWKARNNMRRLIKRVNKRHDSIDLVFLIRAIILDYLSIDL
jgi:hypothetical protein